VTKLLTWGAGFLRKAAKFNVAVEPQRKVHRRIDVSLSVYARVDESIEDVKYLLNNSSYALVVPSGVEVFRVEIKDFSLN
jgi:hypothetical protein